MADNRIGGCEPTRPPQSGVFEPIHAVLQEVRDLGPEDYRRVAATLKGVISPGKATAPIGWSVPNTHKLIIEGVSAHIAFTDPLAELKVLNHATDVNRGLGDVANLTLEDRIKLKLMNCMVTLQNADRTQAVFENGPLSLYSLFRSPLDWTDRPHIVPKGEKLDGVVQLISQDEKIVGGATEYGIVIYGTLVRVERS